MAPRRGGGGGSSSGGSSGISSCPGAFTTTSDQVYFASDVLFFVMFLGISMAFCISRKKGGAGRKLLGIPFIFALFFLLIKYACSIIATVLQQCATTDQYSYYDWQIAITVFVFLAYWLLLVVFVWTLNTMLREQLGQLTVIFKVLYISIVGVMGALTCALIGLHSYNWWTLTEAGQDQDAQLLIHAGEQYPVAYYILYMLSVLVAGGLALMTIFSMRSRRIPAGDLLGWVIALTIAMLLWVLFDVVFAVSYLQNYFLSFETTAALIYLLNFFQVLSFIFILCIAKHAGWNQLATSHSTMTTPNAYGAGAPQQQYAYNTQPNGQVNYYQQAPGYYNAPEVVK